MKWLSRKFLISIAAAVFFILTQVLNIDFSVEATVGVVVSVIGWIVTEGYVDAKRIGAEIGERASYYQSQIDSWYDKYQEMSERYNNAVEALKGKNAPGPKAPY